MKIVDVLKQSVSCAKRMSVWALALSGLFAPSVGAVTITSVAAQQRLSSNGLVDITVTFGGTASDVAKANCTFTATDSATKTALPVLHITRNGNDSGSGNVWTRNFVWDTLADVGGKRIDDVELVVELDGLGGVQLWEGGPYWAECNVGASKPEEYGLYFWWGDTVGHADGWTFTTTNCPTVFKSDSELRSLGYIDSSGNLASAHDAARKHLGSPWRMPTDAEFASLISNCDTEWTTRNGVNGRLVKGRGAYASKSIFLPAAGRGYDSGLSRLGSYGFYWSSTPNYSGNFYDAWTLDFLPHNFERSCGSRNFGQSVRPVRESVAASTASTHLSLNCGDHKIHFDVNDEWFHDGNSASILYANIYPATGTMDDLPYAEGRDVTLPQNKYAREGFEFSGWAKAKNFNAVYQDGATIKANELPASESGLVLYAVWKAKTVVITLDYRDWSGASQNIKTKTATTGYGVQMPWFPIVSSSSDVIDGWYTAPSGGTRVDTGVWWVPTKDTTLYLHWQRKEYTVKFDPNGGEGKMASKKFQYGIATALPANQFVCSGCRFKGWSTTAGGSVEFTDGQQVKQIKSMAALSSLTVKLYAVWEPVARPVKVVFDPMGGTADYTEWTYEIGKPYGRLPNVTHNGYTFKGWRTQSNGGSVVDANTSAAASVTKLYAWLVSVSYAIDYCETKGAANPNPTSYDIEDEIVFSPLPNLFGYTFVRWEPSMISRGSTGDRTVTAIWKTATYSVVYKPGRLGQGDEVRASKTHDQPLTLQAALYTREGYRQIGWTTHEDGQKEYELRGTYDVNSALTLYPAWDTLPIYTITYNPGYYGSGKPIVERYYAGTVATLRGALFSREGCVQTGWTTVDGEKKTHSFGETYNEDKNLVLYASWVAPQVEDYYYKVVYEVVNGEVWITGYRGAGGDIAIPTSINGRPVVRIDDGALHYGHGYWELTSVVVPEGVRTIGRGVFGGDSLKSVSLPQSLEEIGGEAFMQCTALTSVTIPSRVKTVGSRVFEDCSSLGSVTLEQGVGNIGERMFSGCGALKEIRIPGSVENIGECAFEGCCGLSVATIENGVVSLGYRAFSDCSSLKEIRIPGSVEYIGMYAFKGCYGSSTVTIGSGVVSLDYGVFTDCRSVKSFVIPESVTSIGHLTFSGCASLERVVFLGSRPEIYHAGGAGLGTLDAPSACTFFALSEQPSWGVLPTTWDYHTVKGHMLSFPCTIMFDPNGGMGRMDDLVCESGERVYKLPPCTFTPPAGKRFAGWRSMLGKRYDDGMLVFGLRSLGGIVMMTAIWE